MNDTGLNKPEKVETLMLQQQALLSGKRKAQMFPIGTAEINLPGGFARVKTERGVFHYDPSAISGTEVVKLSQQHRENELLGLGPHSKEDVLSWINKGEALLAITEVDPSGIEIKTAIASPSTLLDQWKVFQATKLAGSEILVESVTDALKRR